jgi:pyrroloquinoline quinone biosynthesis protein B
MRRSHSLVIAFAALALLSAACRSAVPDASQLRAAPYVLVLGTAQDGGIPQIGCNDDNCVPARLDPQRKRRVTSLLLCDPRDGRRWLFDCTPDVGEQLALAHGHPPTRLENVVRPPLFEGLFLTHAHMGHYGGLLELGREAYAVHGVPTWVSPRFAAFLRANAPWSLLVQDERLALQEVEEGQRIELAPDLFVVPVRVPHRDELSDTFAFEIHGPQRTLLYLPDIDKWQAWDASGGARRIERELAACDFALLDGTFCADGEVPGRSLKDIPHPFIAESIERFAKLPASERAKVFFTHLNHTNPAAAPGSAQWRRIEAHGMHVLEDGTLFGL